MSANLHLESRRLTAKEARRKAKPKDYVVFDLYQTPTELSWSCSGKASHEVATAYSRWCQHHGLDPEHLDKLQAFLTEHPDHVWSVW